MATTHDQQLRRLKRLTNICDQFRFWDWSFTAHLVGVTDEPYVLIRFKMPSSNQPDMNVRANLSHRVAIPYDCITAEPVIAKLFSAIEYIMLHEVKEGVRYQGHRVFPPHG